MDFLFFMDFLVLGSLDLGIFHFVYFLLVGLFGIGFLEFWGLVISELFELFIFWIWGFLDLGLLSRRRVVLKGCNIFSYASTPMVHPGFP